MSARARLSPADLVTILNGVFGFVAIAVLVRHWARHPADLANGIQGGELKLAGALIGCGALCDVADGVVARTTWTSGMGGPLDAMADTVTFGVAPALLIAVAGLGFPSPFDDLALAVATGHLVAVVIRLAHHSVVAHSPADGFVGITSPLGALGALAVLALGLGPAATITGVLIVSALMVGPFRYPHQTQPAVMAVVVACVCGGVAAISGLASLRVVCAAGLLTIVLVPLAGPAATTVRRHPGGRRR